MPAESHPDDLFVLALSEVQPVLRGYIGNLLPHGGEVDDVLQETNLVLWQKRGEFDASRPFRPWACRFAYFQVLGHLKKATRSRDRSFDPEVLDAIAEETEKRADGFERRAEALRGCLEKLPDKHRTLLENRYRGGESVTTLAELAGKSADAISMTLFRVRRTLKDCIERNLVGGGS